jgi:Tfp pilus assembly protein PilN
MMRQIDLLPASFAEKARERRSLTLVITGGLALLLALVGWWFMLGGQIGSAESELSDVQAQNSKLQTQIAELQRFADLEAEVQAKEVALQTVMTGDVAWPSILTEIAMVVPGEVWFKDITASAGVTEGAQPVGTETAPVLVNNRTPVGRIQFNGASLTMPGVAKWLIRLGDTNGFAGVWLNSAAEAQEGDTGQTYFDFDSTIELNKKMLSKRYVGGTP